MTIEPAASLDEVLELFDRFGDRGYDEQVSQRSHMNQTAALALADGAPDALVAAAMLHDVGHFLVDEPHEATGAAYLRHLFPTEVLQPVALHVAAKRYLVAIEAEYANGLSDGSKASLRLQGGPMDDAARRRFLAAPGAMDAVRLRRWDDRAKELRWTGDDIGAPSLWSLLERVAAPR